MLDAQRAIDLPNFGSFNGPTVLEAGRIVRQQAVDLPRPREHGLRFSPAFAAHGVALREAMQLREDAA